MKGRMVQGDRPAEAWPDVSAFCERCGLAVMGWERDFTNGQWRESFYAVDSRGQLVKHVGGVGVDYGKNRPVPGTERTSWDIRCRCRNGVRVSLQNMPVILDGLRSLGTTALPLDELRDLNTRVSAARKRP